MKSKQFSIIIFLVINVYYNLEKIYLKGIRNYINVIERRKEAE